MPVVKAEGESGDPLLDVEVVDLERGQVWYGRKQTPTWHE